MIVMLNGSFGVGKTTTAREVAARLPRSAIFDPELLGQPVRALTAGRRSGPEDTDDFQDIALWRRLTVATARALYREERPLIVPMTLANPAYFAEIRDGFARITPHLHHFCLVAPLDIVHARLRERGDGPGSWPHRKATVCVPALADARFRVHIDTAGMTPVEVAERIVAHLREGGASAV